MNSEFKKIIIATGGTGGHVFPAYNLAKHFYQHNINVQIISDKRGLRYLQDYNDIKIIEISSSTIFKKNIIQQLFSMIQMQIYVIFLLKKTIMVHCKCLQKKTRFSPTIL